MLKKLQFLYFIEKDRKKSNYFKIREKIKLTTKKTKMTSSSNNNNNNNNISITIQAYVLGKKEPVVFALETTSAEINAAVNDTVSVDSGSAASASTTTTSLRHKLEAAALEACGFASGDAVLTYGGVEFLVELASENQTREVLSMAVDLQQPLKITLKPTTVPNAEEADRRPSIVRSPTAPDLVATIGDANSPIFMSCALDGSTVSFQFAPPDDGENMLGALRSQCLQLWKVDSHVAPRYELHATVNEGTFPLSADSQLRELLATQPALMLTLVDAPRVKTVAVPVECTYKSEVYKFKFKYTLDQEALVVELRNECIAEVDDGFGDFELRCTTEDGEFPLQADSQLRNLLSSLPASTPLHVVLSRAVKKSYLAADVEAKSELGEIGVCRFPFRFEASHVSVKDLRSDVIHALGLDPPLERYSCLADHTDGSLLPELLAAHSHGRPFVVEVSGLGSTTGQASPHSPVSPIVDFGAGSTSRRSIVADRRLIEVSCTHDLVSESIQFEYGLDDLNLLETLTELCANALNLSKLYSLSVSIDGEWVVLQSDSQLRELLAAPKTSSRLQLLLSPVVRTTTQTCPVSVSWGGEVGTFVFKYNPSHETLLHELCCQALDVLDADVEPDIVEANVVLEGGVMVPLIADSQLRDVLTEIRAMNIVLMSRVRSTTLSATIQVSLASDQVEFVYKFNPSHPSLFEDLRVSCIDELEINDTPDLALMVQLGDGAIPLTADSQVRELLVEAAKSCSPVTLFLRRATRRHTTIMSVGVYERGQDDDEEVFSFRNVPGEDQFDTFVETCCSELNLDPALASSLVLHAVGGDGEETKISGNEELSRLLEAAAATHTMLHVVVDRLLAASAEDKESKNAARSNTVKVAVCGASGATVEMPFEFADDEPLLVERLCKEMAEKLNEDHSTEAVVEFISPAGEVVRVVTDRALWEILSQHGNSEPPLKLSLCSAAVPVGNPISVMVTCVYNNTEEVEFRFRCSADEQAVLDKLRNDCMWEAEISDAQKQQLELVAIVEEQGDVVLSTDRVARQVLESAPEQQVRLTLRRPATVAVVSIIFVEETTGNESQVRFRFEENNAARVLQLLKDDAAHEFDLNNSDIPNIHLVAHTDAETIPLTTDRVVSDLLMHFAAQQSAPRIHISLVKPEQSRKITVCARLEDENNNDDDPTQFIFRFTDGQDVLLDVLRKDTAWELDLGGNAEVDLSVVIEGDNVVPLSSDRVLREVLEKFVSEGATMNLVVRRTVPTVVVPVSVGIMGDDSTGTEEFRFRYPKTLDVILDKLKMECLEALDLSGDGKYDMFARTEEGDVEITTDRVLREVIASRDAKAQLQVRLRKAAKVHVVNVACNVIGSSDTADVRFKYSDDQKTLLDALRGDMLWELDMNKDIPVDVVCIMASGEVVDVASDRVLRELLDQQGEQAGGGLTFSIRRASTVLTTHMNVLHDGETTPLVLTLRTRNDCLALLKDKISWDLDINDMEQYKILSSSSSSTTLLDSDDAVWSCLSEVRKGTTLDLELKKKNAMVSTGRSVLPATSLLLVEIAIGSAEDPIVRQVTTDVADIVVDEESFQKWAAGLAMQCMDAVGIVDMDAHQVRVPLCKGTSTALNTESVREAILELFRLGIAGPSLRCFVRSKSIYVECHGDLDGTEVVKHFEMSVVNALDRYDAWAETLVTKCKQTFNYDGHDSNVNVRVRLCHGTTLEPADAAVRDTVVDLVRRAHTVDVTEGLKLNCLVIPVESPVIVAVQCTYRHASRTDVASFAIKSCLRPWDAFCHKTLKECASKHKLPATTGEDLAPYFLRTRLDDVGSVTVSSEHAYTHVRNTHQLVCTLDVDAAGMPNSHTVHVECVRTHRNRRDVAQFKYSSPLEPYHEWTHGLRALCAEEHDMDDIGNCDVRLALELSEGSAEIVPTHDLDTFEAEDFVRQRIAVESTARLGCVLTVLDEEARRNVFTVSAMCRDTTGEDGDVVNVVSAANFTYRHALDDDENAGVFSSRDFARGLTTRLAQVFGVPEVEMDVLCASNESSTEFLYGLAAPELSMMRDIRVIRCEVKLRPKPAKIAPAPPKEPQLNGAPRPRATIPAAETIETFSIVCTHYYGAHRDVAEFTLEQTLEPYDDLLTAITTRCRQELDITEDVDVCTLVCHIDGTDSKLNSPEVHRAIVNDGLRDLNCSIRVTHTTPGVGSTYGRKILLRYEDSEHELTLSLHPSQISVHVLNELVVRKLGLRSHSAFLLLYDDGSEVFPLTSDDQLIGLLSETSNDKRLVFVVRKRESMATSPLDASTTDAVTSEGAEHQRERLIDHIMFFWDLDADESVPFDQLRHIISTFIVDGAYLAPEDPLMRQCDRYKDSCENGVIEYAVLKQILLEWTHHFDVARMRAFVDHAIEALHFSYEISANARLRKAAWETFKVLDAEGTNHISLSALLRGLSFSPPLAHTNANVASYFPSIEDECKNDLLSLAQYRRGIWRLLMDNDELAGHEILQFLQNQQPVSPSGTKQQQATRQRLDALRIARLHSDIRHAFDAVQRRHVEHFVSMFQVNSLAPIAVAACTLLDLKLDETDIEHQQHWKALARAAMETGDPIEFMRSLHSFHEDDRTAKLTRARVSRVVPALLTVECHPEAVLKHSWFLNAVACWCRSVSEFACVIHGWPWPLVDNVDAAARVSGAVHVTPAPPSSRSRPSSASATSGATHSATTSPSAVRGAGGHRVHPGTSVTPGGFSGSLTPQRPPHQRPQSARAAMTVPLYNNTDNSHHNGTTCTPDRRLPPRAMAEVNDEHEAIMSDLNAMLQLSPPKSWERHHSFMPPMHAKQAFQ
eukprot:PhM_4_TR18089/c0_g1_i1/m.106267